MRNKPIRLITLAIILILLLSACTPTPTVDITKLEGQIKEKDAKITELESKIKDLEAVPNQPPTSNSSNIIIVAMNALDSLKNKDMNTLSTLVHPSKGVRFTPYEYVDGQNDIVFTAAEVLGLATNTQIYTWGDYDGIGDPIDLDFNNYYDKFIYDQDFINPHIIGNNVAIGAGNTIQNISTAYPNTEFVEFHFTGFDPQYEGLDWRSLTLVFEDVGGIFYLVGIVHGEWTI